MKKMLMVVAAGAMLYVACKKDENPEVVNLVLNKYNLEGKFKISDATFTLDGSTLAISVYDSIKACKRDNIHQFDTLMVYSEIDAGDSCTSPPMTMSGSYTLTGANPASPTNINFGGVNYLVEKLTVSELVVAKDTAFKITIPPNPASTFNGRFKLYLKKQ